MGKSSKHKAQNVHHFVSFSERIANVNVDVIHKIRRAEHEIEGTYFGEALAQWTDLDLTDHFTNFRREITGQVQTFEQLVHHKEAIVASVKKHLAIPNSLALNSLLDLLVQLARDLQEDFVPHFRDFFNLLLAVLVSHPQDAEILEQTFQTLAYLFRVLWRFLIKDFKSVFSHISHLLGSSHKDYIKVFAAESCAYLLRKVKKKNELLNFLFGSLKKSPELADGVGLLLFEMVKGVKEHFHSTSKELFPLILHRLGPWSPTGQKVSKLPANLVEQSVTVFLQECAEHSNKEQSGELWEMLLDCTSQVHVACLEGDVSADLVNHLATLLRCVSVWLTHNSGTIISDPEQVASTLCVILKSPCRVDIIGCHLMQAVADLLTFGQDRICVEMIHKLTSLVFTAPVQFSHLKSFVLSVKDMSFFEKDVLPGCMQRVNSELAGRDGEGREELVSLLAQIVLDKTVSPVTGEDLHVLQTYPLLHTRNRSSTENSFTSYLESIITETSALDRHLTMSDLSLVWGAVVCLPHVSVPKMMERSTSLWNRLVQELKGGLDQGLEEAMVAALNQLLKAMLIHRQREKSDDPLVPCQDVYDILRPRPASRAALQMLDLYLCCPMADQLLTAERLEETYTILETNLSSPSHHVRLLTCHILSLFPVALPDIDDGLTRESVFTLMYRAEKMVPTVHNYREKLIHMRKLEHSQVIKCLPSPHFVKAPLSFVLANLFWNFKLLWSPVAELVCSHAQEMDTDTFWQVTLTQLQVAAQEAEKELRPSQTGPSSEGQSPLSDLFTQHCSGLLTDVRRPDYTSYRQQLWKTMKKFPEKCVLRSDQLCELYLSFLRNEFSSADEDRQKYQNILEPNPGVHAVDATSRSDSQLDVDMEESLDASTRGDKSVLEDKLEEEEDKEEEDEDSDEEEAMDTTVIAGKIDKAAVTNRRRAAIQSLLVHLHLFSTFKKQRSMFNLPEVQETFYDLLKHRHSSVQKAAFECILSYRSPHILPYRENFERLLDDKTFRSEIVLFRVDEESSEVKAEDREGLLPVLMRILYGKLHGKAGNESAGKSRTNLRRSVIFGFLSGCKPSELKYFLELLFLPCMHFVTDNPVQMVKQTSSTDLSRMIPLKKIKGVLNTASTVCKKMGHRLTQFAHPLLHILLGLCGTLTSALDRRTLVMAGVVKLLKSLRHTVLSRIVQFFEQFEDLDFTDQELHAIFTVAVWPQAEKLSLEGVHYPTPLLKMMLVWSGNKRFFPLLVHKKTSGSSAITPLSCVFSLLNAPKVSPTVAAAILQLVSNLLVEEDEEEEGHQRQTLPDLPQPFTYSPEPGADNLGESLLLPYVSHVLTYLQGSLRHLVAGSSKKKQTSGNELKILARMSRFVRSSQECQSLCELLVPFFSKGAALAQEMEENTLVSLTNLMQYIEQPFTFYRSVAQLFFSIERRHSRTLLCKLLKVVTENREDLSTMATLVEKLNAWDPKRAEEPDYLARLEAFGKVTDILSGTDLPSVDVYLPVVYNCCHFIQAVDDLSIRDNSTHCLTVIVTALAAANSSPEGSKVFNIVIEKTVVPLVKEGIRHKSEVVRQEFLAVLQSLVKNCAKHHMFTGLSDLADADPEADFFENIRHIQIHKRSRALRRLYKHLKDHTFRPEIHMSYFVPLVYAALMDSSYAKHANIQDAAVDLLGAICKQLPWQHYHQLLKFYLKLLPRKVDLQRQLVRIIVALLDAFHFDLSKSTYRVTLTPREVSSGDKSESSESPEEGKAGGEGEATHKDNAGDGGDGVEKMEEDKDKAEEEEEEEGDLPMEVDTTEDEKGDKQEEAQTQDGKVVCSVLAATRIHKNLITSLLPQLHKIITHRAKSEDEHKLVRSKYPEDEEILRVPIALAMVKLLQNLPAGTLENRLPGILLKICNFLRSRSGDVRTTARETLEKIVLSLGPRFFPFTLREMRSILTRGYQLHVLSYTTYQLLKALGQVVTAGQLDPSLSHVQEIFHAELFGKVAEEKDVEAIKAKYFEAKFIKGYDAYQIVAKFVSSGCLNKLIHPVREVLESTHSQRVANKAENVLRKVADGLMSNNSLPLESMMVFINSLTSKLVTEVLLPKSSQQGELPKDLGQSRHPESCLLLSTTPARGVKKPKSSKQTNVHVLVEFGLQLLNMMLKKSQLVATEQHHLQMLDPLVPAIRDCLTDTHIKTNSNAMRCMSWLLKFPLPSLKSNIQQVAQAMFVMLQNYAGAVTAKGGNQELITMCFRAVTVLVREVTYYQLTQEQLQVLLTYCEQDLYVHSRQSTAFNLIKAILSRKLDTEQLHQVMDRLFDMSVTATAASVRLQSRQVILQYLMNYPLGKQLKKHLYFYLDHLNYEMEEGRESVLDMLISFFSTFPQKLLNNHCPKFFVSLAMSSFNDSSAKCRKLVSVALKTLIGKVDVKRRKTLFADLLTWMKSDSVQVRAMSCQVCGMYVEVEGGKFEFYLDQVLPVLLELMEPAAYSMGAASETIQTCDSELVEEQDLCLVAVLTTVLKLVRELSIVRQAKYGEHVNKMWEYVVQHLSYPHTQVRVVSCQLLGLMFSAWEPAQLAMLWEKSEGGELQEDEFLLRDLPKQIRQLTLALCEQLKSPSLDEVLATQVIKNLLYLARVAEACDRSDDLVWLAKKVIREANMEVIHHVKVTLKRNQAFKWVAAVGVSLNPEFVCHILPVVLPALQREMTEQAQDQELKNLAQEVVDLLKKQVGVEAFTAAYANSQKWRLEKREVRKRQIAATAVTQPEVAARKKIRHNLKKKEARKRKTEERRPTKRVKKNKLSILNVSVDDE